MQEIPALDTTCHESSETVMKWCLWVFGWRQVTAPKTKNDTQHAKIHTTRVSRHNGSESNRAAHKYVDTPEGFKIPQMWKRWNGVNGFFYWWIYAIDTKAIEQHRTTKRIGYWQDGSEDPRWRWRLDTGGATAVTLAGLMSQTWFTATQRCWWKLWTYVGTQQAL